MSSKLTDKINEKYNSARETFDKIKKDLKFRLQWAKEFAPNYLPKFNSAKNVATNSSALLLSLAFGYSANGGLENDMQKIANDKMIPAIEVSAAQPLNDNTYVMNNKDLSPIKDTVVCKETLIVPQNYRTSQIIDACVGSNLGNLDDMFKEQNLKDNNEIDYSFVGNAVNIDGNNIIVTGVGSSSIYETIYQTKAKKVPAETAWIVVDGRNCNSNNQGNSNAPNPNNYNSSNNTNVVVSNKGKDNIKTETLQKQFIVTRTVTNKYKLIGADTSYNSVPVNNNNNNNRKNCNSPKNTFKLSDATWGLYVAKTNDFLGGDHVEIGARWQPTGLSYSGPVINVVFIAPLAEGQTLPLDEKIDRSVGSDAHFYNIIGNMNLMGVKGSVGGSLEAGPFNFNLEAYVKVWKPTGIVQIDNFTAQNGYLNHEEGLPFKLNKLLLDYGANLEVNIPLFKGLITPFVSVGYSANDIIGTHMKFDRIAGNSNTYFDNNGIKFNEFNNYNPWTTELGMVIGFNALKQNQRTTHK